MKKKIIICGFIFVLAFGNCTNIYAQGMLVDPGRPIEIRILSVKATKTIKALIGVQGLETTGHIGVKEEVEATTKFQKEFNDYLDTFHDAISAAAEIYGIYHEVNQTIRNIKNLSEVVEESPTNVLAVAFSAKKNVMYQNIVKNSLEIIMDIRKVCFEESKMTEHERNKVLSKIRPKLKRFNKQLTTLTFTLKYTSLMDVWNEILGNVNKVPPKTKAEIIAAAREDWMNNAKSIHP